jgi:hypothetical protein
MQKYRVGQLVHYSAELFLFRGSYKKLQREGTGYIVKVNNMYTVYVFNGVRVALIHVDDIL